MDSFTAQANPSQMATGGEKPAPLLRAFFLLLLIATLAAAGTTTYLLLSRRTEVPKTATTIDNPFTSAEANTTNPFAETALTRYTAETVNPFETEASGDNPFAQFDTAGTGNASTGTNDYANPF